MKNGYHTDQVDYIEVAAWRKAVREALVHSETERQNLLERIEAVDQEVDRLQREQGLIEEVASTYLARLQAPTKRSPLAGTSLKETILINFARPDGIVIGKDAAETLLSIGYFSERRSADGAVYTVLSKPPFVRVDRGIYRVPKDSPDWLRLHGQLRLTNGHQPPTTTVFRAVRAVLETYPNWTRKQVANHLIHQGWDFRGKHPVHSVSGAFRLIAGQRSSATKRARRGARNQPKSRLVALAS